MTNIEWFSDQIIPLPITVKVLEPYDPKVLSGGTKVQRYRCMDINGDFITISVFGSLIRTVTLAPGVWIRLLGCTVNNYLTMAGAALRRDTKINTLLDLGLPIPDIEEVPPKDKTAVQGLIIHFDKAAIYDVCANSNKR